MEIKNFKDLIVWQKAMDFAVNVYRELSKFPAEERYALCDQLRRAVVSIPSNIAEGRGRGTAKDFSNFLRVAMGSLNEVVTQLELACRFGYIQSIDDLEADAAEIGKMLNALISKLKPNP